MKLYHTSDSVIEHPDIRRGRVNADFGQGFYLTPDHEFSCRWATGDAYVNEYELDTQGLRVVEFTRDAQWFDYIFQNRRNRDTLDADVIMGPIANDTIFDTMGIITSGFLQPEEAMQLLLIGPEYRQVVIKTDRAKEQLRWLGVQQVQVDDAMREVRRAEEEAYQQAFAERMEALSED